MQVSKTTYNPATKIWSGPEEDETYKGDISVGEASLAALLRDPDHIAQICYPRGRQYTNREIAILSIRVAEHFRHLKVQQCQVIGICASNSDYLAPLFFGAMLSGLTVSTLDPSFDKDGIEHIYSITKPSMMFCDGAIYHTVKRAFDELNLPARIYTMKDHIEGVPEISEFLQETGTESEYKPEPLKFGANQVATIVCSSGTTGLPKGVCNSHASLLNMHVFQLGPDDKLLGFSTLYWISGLFCLLGGTLCGATRIISEKGFDVIDFFEIVQKYKVNVVFTPPSQIAMSVASSRIVDYDLSSVKTYFSGGSAVPYTLVEKMQPHMPNAEFAIGYGMSEVCRAITMGIMTPKNTAGQLVKNAHVKIVDDEDRMLGPGETGEICMKVLHPWAGYYGNPEATKAMYESDGWLRSGDIGYFDEEGNLYIVDRKKDILKYNNFHFFPTEIEKCISEMTAVAEVCVFGIPDIVSTYLPAAAVVKLPGSNLTESDVYNYVAEKMAHFKQLRGGVYFFDELPKTASGKNLRRRITEICAEMYKARLSNTNGSKGIPKSKKLLKA